jgi:hypothetical protein
VGTAWTNLIQTFLVIPTGATTGARIAINVDNSGAILIYNASNQLFEAIAAMAGTDPFGNSYPAGFSVGVPDNPQVVITVAADGKSGLIFFPTGNPDITNSSALQAFEQGSGASGYDQFQILGAENSTQLDSVLTTWLSSSSDGTQQPQIQEYYHDPLGTYHLYRLLSYAGCTIEAGSIVAVQPGTGTSRANPAVAETWHSPTPSALWTTTGTSQPVRYRYMPDGTVLLDGELITTGAGPWPANVTMFSLGAGYMPPQGSPFITRSDIAVAAGQCTVNVLNSGGVQNGQVFTAAGQRLWFTGIRFPTS